MFNREMMNLVCLSNMSALCFLCLLSLKGNLKFTSGTHPINWEILQHLYSRTPRLHFYVVTLLWKEKYFLRLHVLYFKCICGAVLNLQRANNTIKISVKKIDQQISSFTFNTLDV